MMVLAVATFGYISLNKLPVNLLPEIAYPTITVRTEYPAQAPKMWKSASPNGSTRPSPCCPA